MHYAEYPLNQSLSNFMYRVFGWMSLALAITATIAYVVASSTQFSVTLQNNPFLLFAIIIAQLALVITLSMFLFKLSFPVAFALFMLYAASVGLMLSSIFLVYDLGSIYATFIVTAGMFGSMCLYGYFTRTDLTSLGNLLFMVLIGIVLAMLVNLYFQNQTMDYVISGIGVLVFTGLTAYDAQKIKLLGQQLAHNQEQLSKMAILGALTLYLDFINLFLFLLRFLGKRRNQ